MNIVKPKLIDPNIFKRLTDKHLRGGSIVDKWGRNFSSNLLQFFDSYKGLVLVVLALMIFLFMLHKFNKGTQSNKPNSIEVNYTREVDYDEDKVVKVKNTIENEDNIPLPILDIVKKEINSYDRELSPFDVNSLSGF